MGSYRILTLDGGGVKGLFAASLLDRLAAAHPPLLDRVDLIAGTSTGGILALGLAAGKTPAELTRLYRERAAAIFDDTFWDDLVDLGRTLGADYRLDGLRRALRREFGKRTLGQLRKRVLVPAFDLDAPAAGTRPRTWKPKFFHNYPGEDSDRGESVVEVALRTSAAPIFFPTYQGYVDGGVVANNPSMAALAQALDPRAAGRRLAEIMLLSVGGGSAPQFVRGQSLDWGWAQWARPLTTLMIGGVMGVADFQCRQVLRRRYFRLDAYHDRVVESDDARPETLDYLVRRAGEVELDDVVAWLRRRRW